MPQWSVVNDATPTAANTATVTVQETTPVLMAGDTTPLATSPATPNLIDTVDSYTAVGVTAAAGIAAIAASVGSSVGTRLSYASVLAAAPSPATAATITTTTSTSSHVEYHMNVTHGEDSWEVRRRLVLRDAVPVLYTYNIHIHACIHIYTHMYGDIFIIHI